MNSRKLRKVKKHRGRKIVVTLLSIIVVLALIAFGAIMLERHMIAGKTEAIISKIVPNMSSLGEAVGKSASASPSGIANKLNENADAIVNQSQGLIDSAKATSTNSGVTYTVQSSKLNTAAVNTLLTTNGDQAQTIADKVLDAMSQSGVEHPKLKLQLTNASGETVKTLTYDK